MVINVHDFGLGISFLASIPKQTITVIGSWSISEEHHQEGENKTYKKYSEELLKLNNSDKS